MLVQCKKTSKLFVIKEILIDKLSKDELLEAKKEVAVREQRKHLNGKVIFYLLHVL